MGQNNMRQDWIEFETDKETEKCKSVCLRPEHILAIQDRANKDTRLTYDCNSEIGSIDVAEPYEQVKQKIMDVEKVDYSNVVAEHFTREEYELIENVMLHKVDQLAKDEPCTSNYYAHDRILIKLNEILKEDE